MIRILLVEDHELFRAGLKKLIADMDMVTVEFEAGNCSEFLNIAKAKHFDLVILDLSLPDNDGILGLNKFRSFNKKTPVLVLTMHSDSNKCLQALRAGANGYLTKDRAPEELKKAIVSVTEGKRYLTHTLSQAIVYRKVVSEPSDLCILTKREMQVLNLILEGKTIKNIAELLCINEKTVSTYKSNILKKTGCKSLVELTIFAIKNNLISLKDWD